MSRSRVSPLSPNFWVPLRIWSVTGGFGSHQFVSSFHTNTISKPISYSLCKTFLFGSCDFRNLRLVSENANVFPLRWISSSSNRQSFTVSYLVKSFGFSAETALTISKRVSFGSPEKADKVMNLFKNYGFTQTQISKLVRIYPKILLSDAEKNILPKLEFFEAKGISSPEIAKMLSASPSVLKASLSRQIMPSYDFFKSLFQYDEKLIQVVKKWADILVPDIEKNVARKIDILREHGVPEANLITFFSWQPNFFTVQLDRFREIVEKVVEMGFDASKVKFLLAVNAFRSMSKSTWESKVDAYKKCGWTEEDVLNVFQRNPWCMMISEDKIMADMNFFINKMGSTPSLIANHSKLLQLSLKKRLIPRYSVFQVLVSKGLVKKEISLAALFDSPEKKFLQNFVMPYKEEAPELLKLYKEKLNLSNGPLADKV